MNPTPSDEQAEFQAEFVAFVQARQHRLLRSAYLMCGDHHRAEDLLQDALVKLALRWRQVRHGEPEAYLRKIMYRDAVSWWRRRRRETLVDVVPLAAGSDSAEPVADRVVFAAALARLAPRQRAVLVLRFFDDLTEARTAQVLGVSVGTVKSQTSVALRRLRALAPELGELLAAGRER
ncbi:SigE family RNA polymerase sigma factor [Dactylosporangium sp. NPDC051484]|uniref:SigE family RNA polymerase sigma factor n=1 Tax=Dactylosporangium sp. NPDC051484 TaxID=3154942 RepID=UPI0034504A32